VQRTAVRRVDANAGCGRKPRESTALGAMAVHDVGLHGGNGRCHVTHGNGIAPSKLTLHRYADQTERQIGGEGAKFDVRDRARRRFRNDDTDPMPARRLTLRQIEHVAKRATQRRAKHVEDIQRRWIRHR
jgi:hypothetical protein